MPQALRYLFLMLLLTGVALPVLADAEQALDQPREAVELQPFELWYIMQIGGEKAGYTHVKMTRDGQTWVTQTMTKMSIGRGAGTAIDIEQSSTFVETLDFTPLHASSKMLMATMATEQRIEFGPDQWELTETGIGGVRTRKVDAPAQPWLTPAGLAAEMERRIAAGEEQIEVTTLDLATGLEPVTMKMTRLEAGEVEVFGRVIPATLWSTELSIMPDLKIEQWVDHSGNAVRQTIAMMPGMDMTMLLADEQLALAPFDAPEMLAGSLLTPDRRINRPRDLRRGVFDLSAPGLRDRVSEIHAGGFQTCEWRDENTLRVTIDLGQPNAEQAEIGEAFIAASSVLDHEDPEIQKLAARAVAGKEDAPAAERGEAIRVFVNEFIDEKNLSVGFATASEVARTAEGDCSEHACLVAAMLRADGIPSRTITGLVYADQFAGRENIFGFHMWAQAWIDHGDGTGHWMDLDAALPGRVNGFDATHIALTASAMQADAMTNELVNILPMMQGIEIMVVEAE